MLGSVVWDKQLHQGFERKELPELAPSFTTEDLALFFNNLKTYKLVHTTQANLIFQYDETI
jgi:hypothetical protein